MERRVDEAERQTNLNDDDPLRGPGCDLGGLERHQGGVVYPRWARTWKNASLFLPNGRKVWFGDIGRHQVHEHLRHKGTFYVLSEGDVWPLAETRRFFGADTVQRFWADPAYLSEVAVAKIIDGRWYWQHEFAEAKYRTRRHREEANGQRQRHRQGLAPLSCCRPDRPNAADMAAFRTVQSGLEQVGMPLIALFNTGRHLLRFVVDDEELPRIRALAAAFDILRLRHRGPIDESFRRPLTVLGGLSAADCVESCQEEWLLEQLQTEPLDGPAIA